MAQTRLLTSFIFLVYIILSSYGFKLPADINIFDDADVGPAYKTLRDSKIKTYDTEKKIISHGHEAKSNSDTGEQQNSKDFNHEIIYFMKSELESNNKTLDGKTVKFEKESNMQKVDLENDSETKSLEEPNLIDAESIEQAIDSDGDTIFEDQKLGKDEWSEKEKELSDKIIKPSDNVSDSIEHLSTGSRLGTDKTVKRTESKDDLKTASNFEKSFIETTEFSINYLQMPKRDDNAIKNSTDIVKHVHQIDNEATDFTVLQIDGLDNKKIVESDDIGSESTEIIDDWIAESSEMINRSSLMPNEHWENNFIGKEISIIPKIQVIESSLEDDTDILNNASGVFRDISIYRNVSRSERSTDNKLCAHCHKRRCPQRDCGRCLSNCPRTSRSSVSRSERSTCNYLCAKCAAAKRRPPRPPTRPPCPEWDCDECFLSDGHRPKTTRRPRPKPRPRPRPGPEPGHNCKIPKSMDHSELKCTVYPSRVSCKQTCVFGYALKEGERRKQKCSKKDGKWSPSRSFSDCKPFVDCTLRLRPGGKKKCTSNYMKKGPKCDVSCKAYSGHKAVKKKTYRCNIEGEWSPRLPHCAKAGTNVRLVQG